MLENTPSNGAFIVNIDDKSVCFRNGIDLRGLESNFSDQMILNLFAEHDSWILLTLEGLKHVKSGITGLEISSAVIDFILAGGQIEPEIVNQKFEAIKNPPKPIEAQLSNIQSDSSQSQEVNKEQHKTILA